LRAESYDLAIVLRRDHWWGALLALAAGIPLRVGGDTPETRPLLTHHVQLSPDQAWGEQALGIARLAVRVAGAEPRQPEGVEPFTIPDAAREKADALWQQQGLDTRRRVVGIHPAAGAPLKSWPLEHWACLADRLLDSDVGVALVGAPEDADLLAAIARRMRGRVPEFRGQSLDVSAALYARCGVVVSVDSGAGHLAAAVGTRTVRLYGPASPVIFGPWPPAPGQRVLMTSALACAPCGYLASPPCGAHATPACMLALEVEDVLNAVRAELDQG
jgi:ADP-heptose:LPS heptosyltransferase